MLDLLRDPTPTVSQETLPILRVPLDKVLFNPYQRRQHYDADSLMALASGIQELKAASPATLGLQQIPQARLGYWQEDTDGQMTFKPIRAEWYGDAKSLQDILKQEQSRVQIKFGHRRLLAFHLLANGFAAVQQYTGLAPNEAPPGWQIDPDYAAMPLLLSPANNFEMWQNVVIENAKRQDINPIEQALTLQQAIEEFGLKQEEAGHTFGWSRPTTANKIRLLKLPAAVRQQISTGKLTERHGRELLTLLDLDASEQVLSLAKQAIDKNWTVEQLSRSVKYVKSAAESDKTKNTELAAARLAAQTWCLPGTDQPLGPGRVVEIESYKFSEFSVNSGVDIALFEQNECGLHCPCLVAAFSDYRSQSGLLPDPTNAPHVCLGCTDHNFRHEKQQRLKKTGSVAKTPGEVETEQKRKQTQDFIARVEQEARDTIARRRFSASRYWSSLAFWRVVATNGGYSALANIANAVTIDEAFDTLLWGIALSTRRYNNDINEHLMDLEALGRLLDKIAHQPTAQPGTGESQRTYWQIGWDADEDVFLYNELSTQYHDDNERLTCINSLLYDFANESNVTGALMLRLIEECSDKTIRDEFWKIYNKFFGTKTEES